MVVVENVSRRIQESGITRLYFYRMIKDEVSLYFRGSMGDIQTYGIEVERQDILDGQVIKIERDCINFVSPYRHKVHSLIKTLYDNTVSPIHLIDIIGEEVDNNIEHFEYELESMLTN